MVASPRRFDHAAAAPSPSVALTSTTARRIVRQAGPSCRSRRGGNWWCRCRPRLDQAGGLVAHAGPGRNSTGRILQAPLRHDVPRDAHAKIRANPAILVGRHIVRRDRGSIGGISGGSSARLMLPAACRLHRAHARRKGREVVSGSPKRSSDQRLDVELDIARSARGVRAVNIRAATRHGTARAVVVLIARHAELAEARVIDLVERSGAGDQ